MRRVVLFSSNDGSNKTRKKTTEKRLTTGGKPACLPRTATIRAFNTAINAVTHQDWRQTPLQADETSRDQHDQTDDTTYDQYTQHGCDPRVCREERETEKPWKIIFKTIIWWHTDFFGQISKKFFRSARDSQGIIYRMGGLLVCSFNPLLQCVLELVTFFFSGKFQKSFSDRLEFHRV